MYFDLKSKKDFMQLLGQRFYSSNFVLVPINKGFSFINYDVNNYPFYFIETRLTYKNDIANIVYIGNNTTYKGFVEKIEEIIKQAKIEFVLPVETECSFSRYQSDSLSILDSNSFLLIELYNKKEKTNKNIKKEIYNMNNVETNKEEGRLNNIAFEFEKKDVLMFASGVLGIIGSVFGFKNIKKSESKSKKLLWGAVTVLSSIGAAKSIYKISDSLLLPDNCDELENE